MDYLKNWTIVNPVKPDYKIKIKKQTSFKKKLYLTYDLFNRSLF